MAIYLVFPRSVMRRSNWPLTLTVWRDVLPTVRQKGACPQLTELPRRRWHTSRHRMQHCKSHFKVKWWCCCGFMWYNVQWYRCTICILTGAYEHCKAVMRCYTALINSQYWGHNRKVIIDKRHGAVPQVFAFPYVRMYVAFQHFYECNTLLLVHVHLLRMHFQLTSQLSKTSWKNHQTLKPLKSTSHVHVYMYISSHFYCAFSLLSTSATKWIRMVAQLMLRVNTCKVVHPFSFVFRGIGRVCVLIYTLIRTCTCACKVLSGVLNPSPFFFHYALLVPYIS